MPYFSVKSQAQDPLKLAGSKIRSKFEVVKSTGCFLRNLLCPWKSFLSIVQMLVNTNVWSLTKSGSVAAWRLTYWKVSVWKTGISLILGPNNFLNLWEENWYPLFSSYPLKFVWSWFDPGTWETKLMTFPQSLSWYLHKCLLTDNKKELHNTTSPHAKHLSSLPLSLGWNCWFFLNFVSSYN